MNYFDIGMNLNIGSAAIWTQGTATIVKEEFLQLQSYRKFEAFIEAS
jgi:hypothetical protein